MIENMDGSGNYDVPQPGATLAEVADWGEALLEAADLAYGHGTDNARDEAVWLLLSATGRSPVAGDIDPQEALDAAELERVRRLFDRRIQERLPAAYLTGEAWFAGLAFRVDGRSLVPRSPIAELIVDRFEPWVGDRPVDRILEIGTGCGCIAVACAAAFPGARVDATDIDPEALALARANVDRHGVADRVALHRADVYAGLPDGRRYDLIVSNPPYVDRNGMTGLPREYRHEPASALDGGTDGLDVIRRIVDGAAGRLAARGLLVVETGRAAAALEQAYPGHSFTWIEFAHGGQGVCAITREELLAAEAGAR